MIARSNEAKALGIKMGVPFFKIRQLVEENRVQAFSSNYALYGDMSARVMKTLSCFTPNIEVYSIDECFLDLGNFYKKDLNQYGGQIRETVWRWTGILVSLGIAPTKALAKVANKLAKKSAEAKGVLVLTAPRHIEQALAQTKVEDVWGVGGQYAELLAKNGIHTALDFRNAPEAWVKKHMTVQGFRLQQELRGESCMELEEIVPPKKGICTSRSFGRKVTRLEELREATATYAARCARKLRAQKSCAQLLTVFVHTNRFSGTDRQYFNSKTVCLPVASNSDLELIRYACLALEAIFQSGYLYKKAGVVVTEIVPKNQLQLGLLDPVDRERERQLMAVLDSMNGRFGREKVKVAAMGYGKEWNLKCERKSPCYTTRLSELQVVRT